LPISGDIEDRIGVAGCRLSPFGVSLR